MEREMIGKGCRWLAHCTWLASFTSSSPSCNHPHYVIITTIIGCSWLACTHTGYSLTLVPVTVFIPRKVGFLLGSPNNILKGENNQQIQLLFFCKHLLPTEQIIKYNYKWELIQFLGWCSAPPCWPLLTSPSCSFPKEQADWQTEVKRQSDLLYSLKTGKQTNWSVQRLQSSHMSLYWKTSSGSAMASSSCGTPSNMLSARLM